MIDKARIKAIGGSGGNGCLSFHRTRAQPKGGPDGGDGGGGGSVYAVGDPSLNTLLHLTYNALFKAGRGRHGGGKGKTGARGTDLFVQAPLGTLIHRMTRDGESLPVADILDETPVLLAKGGSGGRGNIKFTSSVNQVPLLAEAGEQGETADIHLELRILAEVGIVGMPNAGKSTLLSACSAAKPRVADYPFTTLDPVLGTVQRGHKSLLLVEIPGLIEGAHMGVGLGHEFLRHASRTRLLWHVVDASCDDLTERLRAIDLELERFSPELAAKPQTLVVNKIDAIDADRLRALEERLQGVKERVFFVSAVTGQGLDALLKATLKSVEALPKPKPLIDSEDVPVIRLGRRREEVQVRRENGSFVVRCRRASRLLALANMRDARVRLQLWKEFERMGVAAALEKAGVKSGDTVRLGKVEMEWE